MMPPAVSALVQPLVSPDPPNQAVTRCLSLLRTGRLGEASMHVAGLPGSNPKEQSWKHYLQARLLAERGDYVSAKPMAQSAAARALHADAPGSVEIALAGCAMELEGLALRRLEQPEQAQRVHLAAYALRAEAKTIAGQCESATSVGLCAQQLRDIDSATSWFSRAAAMEGADASLAAKKAAAQFHLASLYLDGSFVSQAVETARNGQRILVRFFPGTLALASAHLCVTHASLRQAEEFLSLHDARAGSVLGEVLALLESTRDELFAFGRTAWPDVGICDEQLDLALRLRSLASESLP